MKKSVIFSNLLWRFAERFGAQLITMVQPDHTFFPFFLPAKRSLLPMVTQNILVGGKFIMNMEVFMETIEIAKCYVPTQDANCVILQ